MRSLIGKKLYRSDTNRVITGICGGIGEYIGIDPIVVRVILLVLCTGKGLGVLLYLAGILLIPYRPRAIEGGQSTVVTEVEVVETKPENQSGYGNTCPDHRLPFEPGPFERPEQRKE